MLQLGLKADNGQACQSHCPAQLHHGKARGRDEDWWAPGFMGPKRRVRGALGINSIGKQPSSRASTLHSLKEVLSAAQQRIEEGIVLELDMGNDVIGEVPTGPALFASATGASDRLCRRTPQHDRAMASRRRVPVSPVSCGIAAVSAAS